MSFEPTDEDLGEDGEGAVSVTLREWIQFVLAAARRHWLLGLTSMILLTVGGVAISLAIPPMFEAGSKILVGQNAVVTPVLSNPNRQIPTIDPMRGVADITMTKENLEAIVRETGLIEHWQATRSSILQLKDWVWAKVVGPIPESEQMRALVGVLETRLSIKPDDATTIQVYATWGDREMVVKIARIARDKFLKAREAQETSVISAAIGVLEDELKRTGDAIEPSLAAVVQAREKVRDAPGASHGDAGAPSVAEATPPAAYVRTAPRPQGPDPTVSAKLAELRTAYRNAQEPWQRRLTELRLQLSELRSQYGTAHPLVVQQEAKIKDATIEPPELVALREEERTLISRIESGAVAVSDGSGRLLATRPAATGPGLPSGPVMLEEAPEVSAARAKLMSAVSKYDEVKNRLDAARIELTTTEIAFKYRYVVVAEPELPRKPVKPNRPVLILASIAAGLLGGLLAGAVRELTSGRVVEPWQVKQIGLPLLADVNLSDRPER